MLKLDGLTSTELHDDDKFTLVIVAGLVLHNIGMVQVLQ
jgi:hypothetical protein